MADGAVGNQDCGVDLIGHAAGDDLRTIDFERHAMTAIGRHPVKTRRNGSDPTRGCTLTQLDQRKVRAGVLGRRVLAVDGDVRDAQVVVPRRIP